MSNCQFQEVASSTNLSLNVIGVDIVYSFTNSVATAQKNHCNPMAIASNSIERTSMLVAMRTICFQRRSLLSPHDERFSNAFVAKKKVKMFKQAHIIDIYSKIVMAKKKQFSLGEKKWKKNETKTTDACEAEHSPNDSLSPAFVFPFANKSLETTSSIRMTIEQRRFTQTIWPIWIMVVDRAIRSDWNCS